MEKENRYIAIRPLMAYSDYEPLYLTRNPMTVQWTETTLFQSCVEYVRDERTFVLVTFALYAQHGYDGYGDNYGAGR